MVDMPLNNIPITTTPESFKIKVHCFAFDTSVLHESPTLDLMLVCSIRLDCMCKISGRKLFHV
jgi:hypothetical protein